MEHPQVTSVVSAYTSIPLNVPAGTKTAQTATSTLRQEKDTVVLSSQAAALSMAVDAIAKKIESSWNRGDPVPPMFLSNEKQIDIIKKNVINKSTIPLDDTAVSKAAETLWKNAGYRLDTAPIPSNTNGSGNAFYFLKISDRKELDKVYEQAEAEGLDAFRIAGDAAFPIAIQRMKEVDIANGGIYGDESDIIPLTKEEWAFLNEVDRLNELRSKTHLDTYDVNKVISAMKNSDNLAGLFQELLDNKKPELLFSDTEPESVVSMLLKSQSWWKKPE
jgi:hypothetical protein